MKQLQNKVIHENNIYARSFMESLGLIFMIVILMKEAKTVALSYHLHFNVLQCS